MVIKGWDIGFKSMVVGECATLRIESDYGYGDSGSPPKIPPKATLLFDVELLGFSKPVHHMSDEEKLKELKELKLKRKLAEQAKAAGVDGLIVVDLPPEEDEELCIPANKAGMNFIRLATPTTDEARLPAVLNNTSGFVYYVSITGITGAASANQNAVEAAVARLKSFTDLPIAVGFGINTPEQVREIGSVADASVVGSAIVRQIENNLDEDGRPKPGLVQAVLEFTKTLSQGVR